MKKTIIGIDLGTTNCTMAYCLLDETSKEIIQFKIPQVIKSHTQDEEFSLPSFIYFPLPEEIDAKMAVIDWDSSKNYSVGLFAKMRGSDLPNRVIASAKSWLCYSSVDRRNRFLPLHMEDKTRQLSPLEACSSLLKHLQAAWDYKMHENPFKDAEVLITVPASFDPSARELVREAAVLAGFPEIVLLEEPQAAFYAWLHKQQEEWRNILKVDDTVLVVDIGGGTTDFSLISVENEEGDLQLKRLAVGDHLLLGGDNIDLCLAYFAKQKLEEAGHNIDDLQLQSLTHVCRQAKEKLLSEEPPKNVDITIMGKGSRLIGGSLKTKISRDEALSLVVDGFIPLVKTNEKSISQVNPGLHEIGLPFAEDPRISCQLAKFLSQGVNGEFMLPTAVLFNGGTLKAPALQARLLELLNGWAEEMSKDPIKVLPEPDFDYAVSLGAVYYGLSRKGEAIRIKSGTSRSYYIGVEDSGPAVPGVPKALKAICVVPFGIEEGSSASSLEQEFALAVGQPATFRFFSLSNQTLKNGELPQVGTIVKNLKDELQELPSIETFLEKNEQDGKMVRVKLQSSVTELGFLELWCVASDDRKWKLEFDVRKK
jgi:molecular chaperone DnaK (HSP70)